MGRLTYDSTITVDFEDRLLAHLQVVIGAKLRRNESFYLTWKDDQSVGDGRSTLWIHASIPLQFTYERSRWAPINRHWIDELMLTANTPGGLHIIPEPIRERSSSSEDNF
jgi:hypothetical protein